MIHELNHVGIRNRDMERTLAFHAALGAQVVFDRMIPGAGTRIVYLQLGEGLVEYICAPDPGEDFILGIDHLAFLTDDLDRDYARLLEAGATEAVAPKPAGTGVGRIAFLHVGAARIELLERDLEMRRPPRTDGLVADLDHYTLATADPAATAAFLTDVIGLSPLATADVDDGFARRYLGLGADAVGLIAADDEHESGAFPSVALRVADVGAALAELARRGLTDLVEGDGAGEQDGRRAVLRDPDGIRFELLDRPTLPSAPVPA